jgi:hypothetical protein
VPPGGAELRVAVRRTAAAEGTSTAGAEAALLTAEGAIPVPVGSRREFGDMDDRPAGVIVIGCTILAATAPTAGCVMAADPVGMDLVGVTVGRNTVRVPALLFNRSLRVPKLVAVAFSRRVNWRTG